VGGERWSRGSHIGMQMFERERGREDEDARASKSQALGYLGPERGPVDDVERRALDLRADDAVFRALHRRPAVAAPAHTRTRIP